MMTSQTLSTALTRMKRRQDDQLAISKRNDEIRRRLILGEDRDKLREEYGLHPRDLSQFSAGCCGRRV